MSSDSYKVCIIDYGLGNLGSMKNMLNKLGVNVIVSKDPDIISKARSLILPGVGSYDTGMKNLNDFGLIKILQKQVIDNNIPILGVCLGMQLFSKSSEEGHLPGLGWINSETIRFRFNQEHSKLKVPHMGWNWIDSRKTSPLLESLYNASRFYFVHSYHVHCFEPDDVLAETSYGTNFTSILARNNIFWVQFHPEKSHRYGMKLLSNFLEMI